MKKVEYKSLGVTIPVSVPESVDEYNKLAGRDNAVLDDATDSTVYRSVLNVFRESFVAGIVAATGIARKVTYKTDADGNNLLNEEKQPIVDTEESAATYIKRVAGDTPEKYQDIANTIAATLVFDPKVKERNAAGPKELAKRYKEAAQSIIDAGVDVAQAVAEGLSTKLGITVEIFLAEDGTINAAPTIEALGNAIRADQQKEDLASKYTAGLV